MLMAAKSIWHLRWIFTVSLPVPTNKYEKSLSFYDLGFASKSQMSFWDLIRCPIRCLPQDAFRIRINLTHQVINCFQIWEVDIRNPICQGFTFLCFDFPLWMFLFLACDSVTHIAYSAHFANWIGPFPFFFFFFSKNFDAESDFSDAQKFKSLSCGCKSDIPEQWLTPGRNSGTNKVLLNLKERVVEFNLTLEGIKINAPPQCLID